MPQNLRQFNLKLPESLLKQLDKLAETKGVTKTELVIQGIRQVLGFAPEKTQGGGIDSDIYQQLDRLEQRLQESVDYQSTVDLKTDKRIKTLEEIVKGLQHRLSIFDIDESLVLELDLEKTENPTNPDIDESVDDNIDSSTETGQLELVRVESSDKNLLEKSKTVDSAEMIKTLKEEDPQGQWGSEHLQLTIWDALSV